MKFLSRSILSILIICLPNIIMGQPDQLREGDLLFQDLDCGPSCDAIEAVTQGLNGANFSHVGLLLLQEEEWMVLEAITAGVVLTPLHDFLKRSSDSLANPKVIECRLKEEFRPLIAIVLKQVENYIGKPYNKAFIMNSRSYYCSEMIYYLFTNANNGNEIFSLYPMTFKQPGSDDYFPQWVSYFKELGEPIPEGKPGLNPGSMSRSTALELVYVYGIAEGWSVK